MATPGQSKDPHHWFLHPCTCSFLDICSQTLLETFPQPPEICGSQISLDLADVSASNIPRAFFLFPSVNLSSSATFLVIIFGLHNNPQQGDPERKHTLLEEPPFLLCSEPVYFTLNLYCIVLA